MLGHFIKGENTTRRANKKPHKKVKIDTMSINEIVETVMLEKLTKCKFLTNPGINKFCAQFRCQIKVIHPKYYKHLKKTAHHSHLGR